MSVDNEYRHNDIEMQALESKEEDIRPRRRTLVKVVGGLLLFGGGIVVGAASNAIVDYNPVNQRELKNPVGAFGAKMLAQEAGKAVLQAIAVAGGKQAAPSVIAAVKNMVGAGPHIDHPINVNEGAATAIHVGGFGDDVPMEKPGVDNSVPTGFIRDYSPNPTVQAAAAAHGPYKLG